MNKLLALAVVAVFTSGAVSSFAQTPAKKEELTKEERMEMRNRADRLLADRAAQPTASGKITTHETPHVKKDGKKHKKDTAPAT